MSRRLTRWLPRGLILAAALWGLALTGEALYMPAKAWAGQLLLQQAWATDRGEPWEGADLRPIARLSAPTLNVDLFVLDSASGKAMAWGPGHVQGTVLPGQPGLSAIGGHRDSHLGFLGDTAPGDRIELETANGTQHFTVTNAEVVDSRTWRYPALNDGAPTLALTTCWPLDATEPGPLRLVVYAVQDSGT